MPFNIAQVQKLYVAYFNRPADTNGLAGWQSQLSATVPATQAQLTTLASGFSDSPEYAALYAGQTNSQIINSLYLNLFGRSAETAGLNHWVGQLDADTMTFAQIALQLTFSAQGTDVTAINNKVTAATQFTNALDTPAKVAGYSGTAAAASARSFLASVTDNPTTLTTATANVAAAVASATAQGAVGPDGATIMLTTGADALTGTSNNDTFNGVLQANGAAGTTIQPGDIINGGAGIDTLSISVAGELPADFTLSAVQTISVERVLLNNFDTHATHNNIVDTSLMSGLTTVGLFASAATGDTIFMGMNAIVGAEMRNGAGDLTLTYNATPVAGTADTQALAVSNLTAGTFTADGIESIAITSNLAKSTLTNVASDSLKTITAAGAADLTFGTALTATTINASAMTGALNVKLGAANQAVTGGAGNDVIDAATNLTSADTIVGGAGVDTLKLSVGAATVAVGTTASKGALFNVSGVEVIDIASTNDDAVLNLDSTVGVTTVVAAANVGVFGVAGTTETDGDTVTFVLNGVSHTTGARTAGGDAIDDTFEGLVTQKINTITGFTAVQGANLVTITNTSGSSEAVEFGGLAITGTGTVATTGTTGYTNVSFTNLTGQAVDVFSADAVTAGLKDASGTTDSLAINLKTLTADKGFDHSIGTITATEIETINLSATGMTDGKKKTVASLDANAIKTLNITGDSDLTISGFGTQATTIDGSSATGDLNLTVSTKDQIIKTGTGNDTIIMAGTLTAADTIDGGGNSVIAGGSTTGKDLLTATGNIGTVTTPAALKIANVETIEVAIGTTAASFIDAAAITGAESIAFSASGAGTVKITNLAANTEIGLGIGAVEFAGAIDVALANATGSADTVKLNYADTLDGATTVVVKTAADIETVSISASKTDNTTGDNLTITSTDMAAANVVVTDGTAVGTLALGTLNKATTNVNASAYLGAVTLVGAADVAMTVSVAGAATAAHDITTSTKNDVITLTGNYSAANTIDTGAGEDILNVTLNGASSFANVSNVETINISVAAGSTASVAANADDGLVAAKVVNISGGNSLSKFTTAGISDETTAQTIDASKFAGAIELTFAENALDATTTIIGGSGTTDKITTSVSTDTTGEVVASVTGVETLVLNSVDGDVNAVIDLKNVIGLTLLDVDFVTVTNDDQVSVKNLQSGVKVRVTSTETVDGSLDNLVIDLADKSLTNNVLDVELDAIGATGGGGLDLDAAGVETLNFVNKAASVALINLAGVAATTGSTLTVNVSGTAASTLVGLSNSTNVVNASTATGDLTIASADRTSSAMTITGGEGADSIAMRNAADVLSGGLGTNDTLVVNFAAILGGIEVNLGAIDQVVSMNGSSNTAVQSGFENVNLSAFTNFGAVVTGSTGANTIVGTARADQITGGNGADVITGGGGADTIDLTETTAAADNVRWTSTTKTEMAVESGASTGDVDHAAGSAGDTITGFVSGSDKLNFAAALVTNVIGTEIDTLLTIEAAGTVTAVARFVEITTAFDGTTGDAITDLNALTTTAVAQGDSFIVFMHDATDGYLFLVEQVSTANTIAAQDVTLITKIVGVTDIANGDLVSF